MEGGEKCSARNGVERAVEKEVFAGLRFAAARAEESIRVKVCFVGAEIAVFS